LARRKACKRDRQCSIAPPYSDGPQQKNGLDGQRHADIRGLPGSPA
jgi:hypothetical protein